ncbi:MAG TPA: NRDE family protein [Trebonia sp.]|nr:NRDE family protein [Trebonia sp.]
MCTVVVSLEPGERVPLRLLGIRDELASRPWRPPAAHWPGSPLIGGIDEQAGGTWLAVHPGVPRVACLLNGRGQFADPASRRSRGELPLQAAAAGPQMLERLAADTGALAAYDPFHLICASADTVTALSWTGPDPGTPGRPLAVRTLEAGTHLFTNAGHAFPVQPGDPAGEPKADHFAEKFAAARPPADPALPLARAWGDWLTLAGGDGLDPAAPAAILVRRELPEGQLYGTGSMTLVSLAADGGIRYDFQPRPGDPAAWYPVSQLEHPPDQVREAPGVDVVLGGVEFRQGPPAVADDPVGRVHGRDLAQRPLLVRDPAEEEVVVLPDQPVQALRVVDAAGREYLGRGDRDVGPAGFLEQFAAGGGVEALAWLSPAAGGCPVPAARRPVVVAEQQHPPGRVDRDHPPRQPLGQPVRWHLVRQLLVPGYPVRLSHRPIIP